MRLTKEMVQRGLCVSGLISKLHENDQFSLYTVNIPEIAKKKAPNQQIVFGKNLLCIQEQLVNWEPQGH